MALALLQFGLLAIANLTGHSGNTHTLRQLKIMEFTVGHWT